MSAIVLTFPTEKVRCTQPQPVRKDVVAEAVSQAVFLSWKSWNAWTMAVQIMWLWRA